MLFIFILRWKDLASDLKMVQHLCLCKGCAIWMKMMKSMSWLA